MNSFILKPIPKIEFGPDSIGSLPHHVEQYDNNVLLLTGAESLKRSGYWERIGSLLDEENLSISHVEINQEPSPQLIDSIVSGHFAIGVDVVISIGGGSVIDAGKAVSAMLPCGHPVTQYLEGVGSKTPTAEKIPLL